MRRHRPEPLLSYVQSYFENYLRQIRGASPHTIRAYGNSLRLFFLYLSNRTKSPITDLDLNDIKSEHVLAFLLHIESERANEAATRNCRLAAIRGFVEHLLRHDLTHADQYRRILAIPAKRSVRRPISYLEPEEVRGVIHGISKEGRDHLRDRALILFLYNTGARISEALAVTSRDLHLDRPRQVRLLGKGRKERYCPLWAETAALLRRLIGETDLEQPIFSNSRGKPLTRDGAAYILFKHVQVAAKKLPSLRKKRVTPHILRHSCAVALLQSGIDLTVIRDYLGHASIATTNH